MSGLGFRPTFVDQLPWPEPEARARLVGRIGELADACECKSFSGYIALRVPESRRRFYSPRLLLGLETTDDGHTRVTGTFGPNANMWSAFLYSHLACGSAALFSGILGFCQCKLGLTAWGLWIFWPATAAIIALCVAGRIGRQLGETQTRELLAIYRNAAGHEVELR